MVAETAGAHAPRAKRVARACDYCHRKRLKCTPNQRPCLNCQLYNAQCTSHDKGRHLGATAATAAGDARITSPSGVVQMDHPPPTHTNDPSIGLNLDHIAAASCVIPGDHFASEWTPAQAIEPGSETQDFGNVLRQLGIGLSSNFWELDRTMLNDFTDVNPNLLNNATESDALATDEMPVLPSDNQRYSVSNHFSPSARSAANSVNGKVSSIESLTKRDTPAAELQHSIPPGVFIRKNETVANYIGLNSTGATLALCLKDALESQDLSLTTSSLRFLIEAGAHLDEVGLSSRLNLSGQELPPRESALRSVDAFFDNVNEFYPILDEESFRSQFEMFYTHDRLQLGALDYSLFYLVVSIGVLSEKHRSESSDIDRLSVDAYQQAWSLFHDSIASPCGVSLQILLLHIVHHLYFGRCGIAWVFCGLAIRISQSLGLHRKSPREMDSTGQQLRLHSRLWWIAFGFDATLSLSQGRPPGLLDATYDQDFYLWNTDINSEGSPLPTRLQIHTWMCDFHRILNRFCNTMHTNDTVSSRMEAIVKVDSDLVAWKDSLPAACRPDQLILVPSQRYPHILIMHLEYFNLMRTIHWTAITLRPAYDSTDRLPPRFQASEALCVHAARSFVKCLNDMDDMSSKKKKFIMSFHVYDYMSAIFVLYRSISKNPSSLSTRTDLEYLRAAKIHLERDAPAEVVGPASKDLLDSMLSSAHDLVWKQTASSQATH